MTFRSRLAGPCRLTVHSTSEAFGLPAASSRGATSCSRFTSRSTSEAMGVPVALRCGAAPPHRFVSRSTSEAFGKPAVRGCGAYQTKGASLLVTRKPRDLREPGPKSRSILAPERAPAFQ
jgi:hypothetical protein